jgi:hypothetical protein
MSAPGLARLVDLALQLESDAERPAAELRRRDRALGRELADAGVPEAEHVVAWLARVRPPEGGTGERVARSLRGLTALCAVAGALLGSGAAAALFRYDGTHPVNVVRVLGFFVALQLLLLAGTLVLSLPQRWRSALPGLEGLQDALSLFSPGRLVGWLRRVLPAPQREAAERFTGIALRHRRLYGDVERWLWLSASQAFGVSFHAGALATALALVAFTDLAFGWSTTLDLDARTLHRVTTALAWPFAGVLPDSVPSAALIEATQFFRGPGAVPHHPTGSAPWWRFVAACMVCYALLPRMLLLVVARGRLAAAVRRAFARQPGVFALRDRLESRLVETTADTPEAPPAERRARAQAAASAPAPGTPCSVLAWAGFPLDVETSLACAGLVASSVARAGEGALAADAAAIESLRRAPEAQAIAVLVKAWEPPLGELLDFLRALRSALGDGRLVALVPIARDAAGAPATPDAASLAIWRRAAEHSGDPWLVVHAREGIDARAREGAA